MKITSGKKVGYKTTGDYEVEIEELELRVEQFNTLVEKYGEIIYEYVL